MYMRHNPYSRTPPLGFNPMNTAPRDGRWIEVANNAGVATHYGLYRWKDEYRCFVGNETPNSFSSFDEKNPAFSWRETSATPSNYEDPTGGMQHTRAYWIERCGLNPNDYNKNGDVYDNYLTGERNVYPRNLTPSLTTMVLLAGLLVAAPVVIALSVFM